MSDTLNALIAPYSYDRRRMNDPELVERFRIDPEGAYRELLERFTPVILRMIRRFMRDPDEIMEVYTAICERLRANDFQALRRFHTGSELTPWLSVVVANACRDRFRKNRASSSPNSVLSKLDERERLIFKYYYQERIPHEDIAELIGNKHGGPCTPIDVVRAIAKINDLLTVKKRWMLLAALNSNRPQLSIDEMSTFGYEPSGDDPVSADVEAARRALVDRLNEALESLEREDQLLVMLRYEQGMTAHEIAGVMRYESHKYVYTRLRTVTNRLRRYMEAAE